MVFWHQWLRQRPQAQPQGYVKVRINPDNSDAEMELFETWGGSGYPGGVIAAPGELVP